MNRLVLKCCDFQIHSPRDPRYRSWPNDLMTFDGFKAWATGLLKRCEAVGVSAIAVTDHHDLLPGLLTLAAAYETGSKIWVFPGMEITASSGIQGILILDPSIFGDRTRFDLAATEALANRIMGTLGQDIAAHAGRRELTITPWPEFLKLHELPEEKRPAIFVSPKTDRVDREFHGEEGIADNLERICKDKYVLLPNLERNKHGVFGNESGRALYMKAGSWFVGGIVGGGNPTDEDAIRGKQVDNYGSRIVACLRTSDQRGQDASVWFGDRIGKADCVSWLKLSEPTTVSVTQALISGDQRRVFQERPKDPTDHIDRLIISGSDVFGPTPFEIAFDPNLNTLIGGRGAGKSLIISALLRVFGQDEGWAERSAEGLTPWEERHTTLFKENGPFSSSDVSIQVEYTRNIGVRYRLRVDSPGDPLLAHRRLEMQTGNDWSSVGEGDAVSASMDFRPLFFLQGQMSAMTGSRLDQRDLIRLIEGPIRHSRQLLRDELNNLATIARDGFQQRRLRTQHENRLAQLQVQIVQKENERKSFLEAAQKGLSEEQQRLFAEAELFRKGKVAAQRLEDVMGDAATSLKNALSDIESARDACIIDIDKLQNASAKQLKDSAYLVGLVDALSRLAKQIEHVSRTADTDLKAIQAKRAEFLQVINGLITKANEISEKERSRRDAVRRAGDLEKDLLELNKQKLVSEQEIQKVNRSEKIEAADRALDRFKEVVRQYSTQLIERANQISASHDFRLVVRVIPGGLYGDVLDGVKAACQGCGVREKAWGQLELALQMAVSPANLITDLIASVISSFSTTGALPQVWEGAGFSEPIFRNILARTKVEDWIELSVILAEDKVDVRYKKGNKAPIPILSASPGERAVELLKLALYSTTGPLIIDQPEDDLDNHFLAENLVELVQQSKHKNQLIFSSHNANLVVHGDAEVIHVMEAKEVGPDKIGCSLQRSGTIDQETVCLEAERVMEGGRTAFEHRRRKYHETVDPSRILRP